MKRMNPSVKTESNESECCFAKKQAGGFLLVETACITLIEWLLHAKYSLDALAAVRSRLCLIDLLEREEFDEFVERELPVAIVSHKFGQEFFGNRIAFDDANQRFSVTHQLVLDIEFNITRSTNHNTGAIKIQESKGLTNASANAGCINGIVYTVTGQRNRLNSSDKIIDLFAVYRIRRTQLFGQLQTLGIAANGNDLLTACNFSSHNGAHTDSTAAKNCNRGTEFRAQTIQYGTGTGLDATAHRRDQSKVHIIIRYLDCVILIDNSVVCKGGLPEEGRKLLSIQCMQTSCSVRLDAAKIDCVQLFADKRTSFTAVAATVAKAKGNADMVTDFEFCHAGADCLNNTGTFMPKYGRQRGGNKLVLHSFIRMANSACSDANQNFTKLRCIKLNILDFVRGTRIISNSRANFHYNRLLF
mgnify:CR=1 FL=1